MKFLIDVGVGRKVEEWFNNSGYDVKSVRNIDINSYPHHFGEYKNILREHIFFKLLSKKMVKNVLTG